MGYSYTDCLEIACMDRFKCSLDDLKVLPKVYSDLAEQCDVDFRVLGSMNNLKVMTEYSFTGMRDYIVECVEGIANYNLYIEVVPDDVDNYVKYVIDDKVKEDILKVAETIKKVKPYIVEEDLTNAKFNSMIDEAIDLTNCNYETYGEEVAETIIQLAFDEGLIKVNKEYTEE